ncbi:MAG: DMT family transporter [Alphaproteobacteria bacterium]|nr:DMT family transporter [Alphaproteobacteria bacterium]MBU1513060.1 DMT family transporter [Alphaproteobacteria bacterium]MBU2095168.1 DMT family transporter [Alphaproteobacteria bacterium]MBU2152091.1 DMT family transporter [Alphaproteobacteria bacterium]MBU2306419.1 DMT family transporter [Alphaproteobacteria bacterium]
MALRDFALLMAMCLVWAINNIVSKYVVSILEAPPLFYAAARFAIVAVCLIPFLRPAPKPIWRLVLTAFLMGGGNFGLMFVGLKYSTPSAAAVVLQLGMPITLILSMIFLGERVRWRRGLGIALTFAGVLVVMWNPHGVAMSTGLMLIAGATLMSGIGVVLTKQIQGLRPITFQAWVGVSSLPPMALLSAWLEPGQIDTALAAGWPFLAAVVFSAIVVSLGAHTIYVTLLQKYEANLISALILVTPLATIGLSVAVFHDPFGPRMMIGTALALAGVLIIALRGNQLMSMLLAMRNRAE